MKLVPQGMLRQRDVRVVVRLSLTCVTLMPEAALIQADRRCLLEGNLLYTQAVLSQQGKQYTASGQVSAFMHLAHMGIDEEDFAELMELLGQNMGGRLPSQEQLKNYECVEQYMMYNTYVGW